MDSVTQIVLGAGVAAAVIGPRTGARKAAAIGAVLGTLPDLDVFIPLGDPITDFVQHRGPSHSLIVQALVTPILAEPLVRLVRGLRDHRMATYLAVYLCLATHALLDAMTVYGTRLFWPVMPEPVGLGSVFIIDPLYTLPLLAAFVWALCVRQWTPRIAQVVGAALVLSTAYLGWSAVAQQVAERRGAAALAGLGIAPERALATPTPFNTLFWRVIAVDGDRYLNLYVPLLGGQEAVTAYAHPRGAGLLTCVDSLGKGSDVAAFSKGFFKLWEVDGRVGISDLRMGVTPNYVFQFEVAARDGGRLAEVAPVRLPANRSGAEQDVAWLWSGLLGERAVRSPRRPPCMTVRPGSGSRAPWRPQHQLVLLADQVRPQLGGEGHELLVGVDRRPMRPAIGVVGVFPEMDQFVHPAHVADEIADQLVLVRVERRPALGLVEGQHLLQLADDDLVGAQLVEIHGPVPPVWLWVGS
jgi:inner membrane protein